MNTLLQQYGVTRTKLAVIAGLLSLLVGVWGHALLGGATRTTAKRTPTPRSAAKASKTPAREAEQQDSIQVLQERTLPVASLDQVAGRDPFRRPHWARTRSSTPRRSTRTTLSGQEDLLRDLREEGVKMVMLSGNKKVATIGDYQVRQGDTFAGYRVLDISAAGVVLSERPVDR